MKDQVKFVNIDKYAPKVGVLHNRIAHNNRAAFAREIIGRFALVSGSPDGEDSAGRARLRKETATEIVDFACDVAERSYNEFEKRGWLEQVPSFEDIKVERDKALKF